MAKCFNRLVTCVLTVPIIITGSACDEMAPPKPYIIVEGGGGAGTGAAGFGMDTDASVAMEMVDAGSCSRDLCRVGTEPVCKDGKLVKCVESKDESQDASMDPDLDLDASDMMDATMPSSNNNAGSGGTGVAGTGSAGTGSAGTGGVGGSAGTGSAGTGATPNTDQDGDGYTLAQGDCMDTDPLVHPGATEILNDGSDSNCDEYNNPLAYVRFSYNTPGLSPVVMPVDRVMIWNSSGYYETTKKDDTDYDLEAPDEFWIEWPKTAAPCSYSVGNTCYDSSYSSGACHSMNAVQVIDASNHSTLYKVSL